VLHPAVGLGALTASKETPTIDASVSVGAPRKFAGKSAILASAAFLAESGTLGDAQRGIYKPLTRCGTQNAFFSIVGHIGTFHINTQVCCRA